MTSQLQIVDLQRYAYKPYGLLQIYDLQPLRGASIPSICVQNLWFCKQPVGFAAKASLLCSELRSDYKPLACKSTICSKSEAFVRRLANRRFAVHSFAVLANLRLLSFAEQAYKTKGFVSVGFVRRLANRRFAVHSFAVQGYGLQTLRAVANLRFAAASRSKQVSRSRVGFVLHSFACKLA